MDWIVATDSILFVTVYLFWTCASAHRIASYESAWAVRVPDKVRVGLLIFSFRWPKISVLAVICQIFTYIMLSFFLVSRFGWMQDWLIKSVHSINQIYTGAFLFQVALIVIALVEEGIYWFRRQGDG